MNKAGSSIPKKFILELKLNEYPVNYIDSVQILEGEIVSITLNSSELITRFPFHSPNLMKIQQLDLSGLGLKNVPASIESLKNLRHLDLSHNQLEDIPQQITTLQALEILIMNSNSFQILPDHLCSLSNLEMLYLQDNELTGLPSCIGELQSLKLINLKNNKIVSLPHNVGNLRKLEYLYLSHNRKLKTLPITINNLSSIQILELIDVDVDSFPKSIKTMIDGIRNSIIRRRYNPEYQ